MKVTKRNVCRALTESFSVLPQEEGLSFLEDISLFEGYSSQELRDMYPSLCPVICRLEKGGTLTLPRHGEGEMAVVLYGTLKEHCRDTSNALYPRARFIPGSVLDHKTIEKCEASGEIIAETACKLLCFSFFPDWCGKHTAKEMIL